MTQFNADIIVNTIQSGQVDASLRRIYDAYHDRVLVLRARTRAQRLSTFGPGDRVQFATNIKPRFLAGVPATVEYIKGQGVHILVDDVEQAGRWKGLRISVSATALEPSTRSSVNPDRLRIASVQRLDGSAEFYPDADDLQAES